MFTFSSLNLSSNQTFFFILNSGNCVGLGNVSELLYHFSLNHLAVHWEQLKLTENFLSLSPSFKPLKCWRFPYLCFKNGGGAFLFPYIICCLVIGFPLFLIELSLGQFSAMGPAHLWANLSPLFKGVSIASVISSTIVGKYRSPSTSLLSFKFSKELLICHLTANLFYCTFFQPSTTIWSLASLLCYYFFCALKALPF